MNADSRFVGALAWKPCCVVLVAALCPGGFAPAAEPESRQPYPAVAAPEWDALFAPPETREASAATSPWSGGDVAGTVDLGGGRTVWVFGDTFIGQTDGDRWAPRSRMISNSVALQTLPADRKPERSQLRFSWGESAGDGPPGAWVAPDSQQRDVAKPVDPGQQAGDWYWFTGGGAQLPSGPMRDRIGLFLFHIGKKQGASGVWAFESVGCALVTIESTKEGPAQWRCRQHRIPFAWGADAVRQDKRVQETSWGVAALSQPAESDAGPDMLFVYGVRTYSPLDKQLLLARVAVDAVEQFDDWRFYAGPDVWSSDPRDAVPVAKDVASELSVESVDVDGKRQLVMVHSQPPLERRILVRTATQPQGPWTEPLAVYSVPEVDRDKSYFAYAAKGHASLSNPGELLISYVVNSNDFKTAQRDLSIYRPRFVRLPSDSVLPESSGQR